MQTRVTPIQLFQRRETMFHDRLRDTVIQRTRLARDTECPVRHAPSCPTRDLCQFVRCQGAHASAIEFGQRGKCHVIDIKVQAHPDRIRRNKIIDFAILVERDLCVSGSRAKRAHHHGRAAFLTADQLCNGIDVVDGEPDDGASRRHPADLFCAGINQLRHTFTLDKTRLGHQFGNRPPHRVRPQKKGLMQPPRAQQTVGKHMPPLGIGT